MQRASTRQRLLCRFRTRRRFKIKKNGRERGLRNFFSFPGKWEGVVELGWLRFVLYRGEKKAINPIDVVQYGINY